MGYFAMKQTCLWGFFGKRHPIRAEATNENRWMMKYGGANGSVFGGFMDILSKSHMYYLGTPESTTRTRFRDPAGCVRESNLALFWG